MVKAAPDGYTLLMVANPNVINVVINPNVSFSFTEISQPIGGIASDPAILVVNPKVPVKTVPELIAYAKANPGKLNMASGGVGSTPHLAGELFKMMTGINMLHVPYRGDAPAVTDMLEGQDQVMFDMVILAQGHVRSDELRALAVTSNDTARAVSRPAADRAILCRAMRPSPGRADGAERARRPRSSTN